MEKLGDMKKKSSSRHQKLMSQIIENVFEGYEYSSKEGLTLVNEGAAKQASDKLHMLVLEKSRELWDMFESSDDSLSHLADEIDFEEGEADPSSIDDGADIDVSESADISSLLGANDFDMKSIFEMSEDEDEMVDGDEDFEDLQLGMDDSGMGAGDLESSDLDDTEDGDEELDGLEDDDMEGDLDLEMELDFDADEEMGMEDELGMGGGLEGDLDADIDMDLEMGDDLDADADLDLEMDDDMEGDDSFDFDLDFGDDEGDLDTTESKDDDDDDDDKDDDKEDDKDCDDDKDKS